jgi:hypothetical protein
VAGQEAGQEDVGALGEFQQHLAPLGLGDVETDAPLAPVGVFDVRVRVALHAQWAGLPQPALRIAGDGVFDLDDVGAPLREHRARGRDEAVHRDLEDPDAVQWAGH